MKDLIERQAAIDAIQKWGLIDGLSEGQAIEILADEEKVPSAQSEQKDFEKRLHDMFDHIWECEIDHPVYQDTVGELMSAVIQAHYNSAQPERKKGEWIENSPVTEKCDQCGYVIRDWFVSQFNFCPNCGAFMMEDDGK